MLAAAQTQGASAQMESGEAFTARQRSVLESALGLLAEGGEKALTTSALARAANCSKHSLYKWFGDRDDLLAALVSYQASKVRALDDAALPKSADEFRDALLRFAEDLIAVLTSETSLALNRLSIGSVRGGEAGLGAVLLEKGKRRIEQRAQRLLKAGLAAGYVSFGDAHDAYQTLYGLIIGDRHIRSLLGEAPGQDADTACRQAEKAVGQFLSLHAAAKGGA